VDKGSVRGIHGNKHALGGITSIKPSKLAAADPRLGRGYSGARKDTTRPSGHTPDKEVEIKNITVYVSGYTETDKTGMLSFPAAWRQQREFVSSRPSGQIPAAVCMGFECRCNGQNVSNRTS